MADVQPRDLQKRQQTRILFPKYQLADSGEVIKLPEPQLLQQVKLVIHYPPEDRVVITGPASPKGSNAQIFFQNDKTVSSPFFLKQVSVPLPS